MKCDVCEKTNVFGNLSIVCIKRISSIDMLSIRLNQFAKIILKEKIIPSILPSGKELRVASIKESQFSIFDICVSRLKFEDILPLRGNLLNIVPDDG